VALVRRAVGEGGVRDLTFICAFFENQGMLLEQQRMWASYPPDLRRHFHAIVTDDCSPDGREAKPVFEPVDIASYRLFRAQEKKRWNWLFARNLGVQEATTEWVLLTDIDHVLPIATLRWIVEARLDPTIVYRFSRVDAPNLTPYKPHPNTWMMTRAMFDKVGGYDERFSGYYGSDSEFRERVQEAASCVMMQPQALIRYPREVIADASTTTYQRKAKEDGVNVPRIKEARSKIEKWRPLRVQLPYTLEASL
jgi:hypothetical protein